MTTITVLEPIPVFADNHLELKLSSVGAFKPSSREVAWRFETQFFDPRAAVLNTVPLRALRIATARTFVHALTLRDVIDYAGREHPHLIRLDMRVLYAFRMATEDMLEDHVAEHSLMRLCVASTLTRPDKPGAFIPSFRLRPNRGIERAHVPGNMLAGIQTGVLLADPA